MILVEGQIYYTIVNLSKNLGVSAKTIRDYLRRGIIPKPPEIRYGMRTVKHFPVEYMQIAKASLEAYREKKSSKVAKEVQIGQ